LPDQAQIGASTERFGQVLAEQLEREDTPEQGSDGPNLESANVATPGIYAHQSALLRT
jgi:hypothetical protein